MSMYERVCIPEDPTSANNANIRQRIQKPPTLVRFLKCHQICATFNHPIFMVDCLSDNTTKSRQQLLYFSLIISVRCAGEQSAASIA